MANNKNKTQNDPVSLEEKVLRRILKDPQYYKPELPIPVQRLAFNPTKDDTNGVSIFRELFTTAEDVAKTGTNPKGYAVARLLVETINGLSLSAVPDPQIDQPPGHSLVPELNYIDKENNKKSGDQKIKNKFKELTFELAKIASKDIALE